MKLGRAKSNRDFKLARRKREKTPKIGRFKYIFNNVIFI